MKLSLLSIIISGLLYSNTVCAQQRTDIEILLDAIETASNDSLKLHAINQAAFYYIFNNPDKAINLIEEGKTFALRNDLLFGYVELLNTQGIYFNVLQAVDSARFYFSKALTLSQENDWPLIEEKSLNNLGMNYWIRADFQQALDYFSKALALNATNQPANPINRAKYLSNIGLIYQELKQFDQALLYHQQSLEIRNQHAIPNDRAISHSNLGVCYKNQGDYNQSITHYKQAIILAQEANNFRMYYSLHDNLGNVFFEKGDFKEALPNFMKALERPVALGPNPKNDLSVLSNLTAIYTRFNEPEKAITYAKKGLLILEENPTLENFASTLLKNTSLSYFLLGDVETGNKFFDRYTTVVDSVFSQQHAKAIADFQVKMETEKKEQQLALQTVELAEQQAIIERNVLILISIVVVSILLIVLIINRNKKKAELMLKERDLLIKETQITSALASQESQYKRFAQDLHDGLGQLLSALQITLSGLTKNTDTEHRIAIAETSDKILTEMSTEIRNIAFNLMPSTLIKGGLVKALEELALRVNNSKSGLSITISSFEFPERLPELYEINLYRIVQEWLNNILKHNKVHHIEVQLVGHQDEWVVTIEDDGEGFDKTNLANAPGNGWKNITSRINLMKGEYTLETNPDVRGSSFMVMVPIASSPVDHVGVLTKNTINP